MKRSTHRILTTHGGALVRPPELAEMVRKRLANQPYDERAFTSTLKRSVAEVVKEQVDTGVDVVDDGEYGKAGGWTGYVTERLGGFRAKPGTPGSLMTIGKDREEFGEFYADAQARGFLFPGNPPPPPGGAPQPGFGQQECYQAVKYTGQAILKRDIENLKAAVQGQPTEEAFYPTVAPASLEPSHKNAYYPSQEAYVMALGEAMAEEYRAITNAGIVLQIDDAWIPALWERMVNDEKSEKDFYKFAAFRMEALNNATQGIPTDRIRYHICWGSWHGPHKYDMPMHKMLPLLLMVRAGAYLFEAANVRHEHEYKDWRNAKVPEGSILVPGVVSHATNVLEHPELVADRIIRYTNIVGRENVMAGTDCGMGNRVHRQLAFAKFESMAEGAKLATKELWR